MDCGRADFVCFGFEGGDAETCTCWMNFRFPLLKSRQLRPSYKGISWLDTTQMSGTHVKILGSESPFDDVVFF